MNENKRKFEECDDGDDGDCDDQDDSPTEIREGANNLLPDKSSRVYKQCYDQFVEWQRQQDTTSVSEETLLVYFEKLSTKFKPSTLWAKYSMLKSTLHNFQNVDIGKYKQVSAFMSRNSKGFVSTKSKILEPRDVEKFLAEAPDRRYLAIKVALILGITGACRREELKNITIHDVEHHDNIIVVKIPRTRNGNEVPRKFMVDGEFCEIIKKYEALRPKNVGSDRFFLCLRDGKCTQQVIGINTFGAMPKMIAEFLGLDEPDKYTGHSFRRTSATMLADTGADFLTLKRLGRRQLQKGYIEDSVNKKMQMISRARLAATQTDFEETTSWEDNTSNVLFCSRYSPRNEVSIQTMIACNPVKTEQNLEPGEAAASTRVGGNLGNTTNISFSGFEDVNDDSTMMKLGGLSQSFFATLVKCIPPNAPDQPKVFKKFCRENRLLMFLMKLKLNLSFEALGCIFAVSEETASSVFFSVLESLSFTTQTWITWPSKTAIEQATPAEFSNYPNCRAILNFIEFECEDPPQVEQRILMYSNCKGLFTTKYFVAISPGGLVTFTSKGYGGRYTDEFITNDSGFLHLVEPGDEIMADNDFPLIRSELLNRQCTLVTPPFAFDVHINEEDGATASGRVHVESAIQRIKAYRILENVRFELLPYIDKIVFIICILVNNYNRSD